jgi:hypothetical protein
MALVLVFGTTRAQANPPLELPATGSLTEDGADAGTFVGTFALERFVSQDGVVQAVGTLSGMLINPSGEVFSTVSDETTLLPLTSASGTCQILHLELGPLDLDLLGLVLHLDRIVLTIDAETGSGNLLGNLLCAVARLLDSGSTGDTLARLLNRILSLL